jgi:hypothetical protein
LFEIISRFALTLAAVVIAVMAYRAQRADRQRVSDEAIRSTVSQIRSSQRLFRWRPKLVAKQRTRNDAP